MFTPSKVVHCLVLLAFLAFGPFTGVQAQNGSASQPISTSAKPETLTMTLEQAIQTALASNREIRKAALGVKDGDAQVLSAWAEVLPDVSASANYTRNIEIPVNFIPAQVFDPSAPAGELVPVQFGTDNNWQGGLTVSQNIFKGQAIIGLSTSRLYKLAQSQNFILTSQQMITQTRQAYHQALLAKERVELLEASLARLERVLEETKVRRDAGLIDDYSVLQIEVQLANQRPSLIEAQNEYKQSLRGLVQILGLPVGSLFDVVGDLTSFVISTTNQPSPTNEHLGRIDQANGHSAQSLLRPQDVVDQRADIQFLESQVALRQKQLLATKSEYLPSISAVYNLQWSSAQPGTPVVFENAIRFQTVGLAVSLPIFQGSQRIANVSRASIELQTFETDLEQAEVSAAQEIATLQDEFTRLFLSYEARQMALEQAREGFDRAKLRLDSGNGSQLELTEAELQLQQAEFNVVQLAHDYLNAKASFDYAIGSVPFTETLSIQTSLNP
ncbi:MAG: TolC family protein [Bacteroidetes bacterium]|nr:TolC family protein [Bacteroidota bacterium]